MPLVLKVETGVGESTLNLEGIKVTDLSLKVGLGQAPIHLPTTGIVTARIDGCVGQPMVTIPSEMESRIKVRSGIGTVRVLGDFQ